MKRYRIAIFKAVGDLQPVEIINETDNLDEAFKIQRDFNACLPTGSKEAQVQQNPKWTMLYASELEKEFLKTNKNFKKLNL